VTTHLIYFACMLSRITIWLSLLICNVACKKVDPIPVADFNGVINAILPVSGKKGDTLAVFGYGFGENNSSLRAFVNGRSSTILQSNDTLILIVVPARAGTGPVSIAGASGGTSGPIFQFEYTATVSRYAGQPSVAGFVDGAFSQAQFNQPLGLACDPLGYLYVADAQNHRIRQIATNGNTSTFSGIGVAGHQDGFGNSAKFNHPQSITIDSSTGNFFVADRYNHCVRKITPSGVVSTIAGLPGLPGYVDAPGLSARFNEPVSVAFEPNYRDLYIGDAGNHCIRRWAQTQVVTTYAGSIAPGNMNGVGFGAAFRFPAGLYVDSTFFIYVADSENHNIRRIVRQGASVTTFSGIGVPGLQNGLPASFDGPTGVCIKDGLIFVADANNHVIRMLMNDGTATTLAGSGIPGFADGVGPNIRFNTPVAIVAGTMEGEFFIADSENHCIRRMLVE
jgi:hypothetical protein